MRLALGAVAALLVAGLLFAMGYQAGSDRATAEHASQEALARQVGEEIDQRQAKRLAGLRQGQQTLQGQLSEVIRANPTYRDCVLDDATRSLLNQARAGGSTGQQGTD